MAFSLAEDPPIISPEMDDKSDNMLNVSKAGTLGFARASFFDSDVTKLVQKESKAKDLVEFAT